MKLYEQARTPVIKRKSLDRKLYPANVNVNNISSKVE